LGPAGFGNSPYSAFCSVAGNPLLVSLEQLVREGDLDPADVSDSPDSSSQFVDYETIIPWKLPLLDKSARRFLQSASADRKSRFEDFCRRHEEWIDDYALFMIVKDQFDRRAAEEQHWGATWNTYWDRDIATREPAALKRYRGRLAKQLDIQRVWQFYFFEQWTALRRYANERGILIVGDMPIFVALDSSDVWVDPQLFTLDRHFQEKLVAGVPPDYFSPTGQRWGNPLYDWKAMSASNFAWWVRRFRSLLELVDFVRIDHFRGFAACWAIPARERTAMNGRWTRVPGRALFGVLSDALGELPFLAEDLGVITPDVDALRDDLGFPGMKLLQVGLEDIEPKNVHLPEHHVENSVVYPGTHDNNTAVGWYSALSGAKKDAITDYMGTPLDDPGWDLMRIAMASRARASVIPMQDVLRLGSEARMNTPATTTGNWRWRLPRDYASDSLVVELAELTARHGRHA
jgi:4-alpha-glucanotransferase